MKSSDILGAIDSDLYNSDWDIELTTEASGRKCRYYCKPYLVNYRSENNGILT